MCNSHYGQWMRGKELKPLRKRGVRPVAPEGYAFCMECESFKKVAEFHSRPDGSPNYRCNACESAYFKKWYQDRKKEKV